MAQIAALVRRKSDCLRTSGVLSIEGTRFATLERPWLPNPAGVGGLPKRSCVPAGTYTVIPHASAKFGPCYALVNHELGVYYQPYEIPAEQKYGRSAILIHTGNYVEDVIGCIAIGMTGTETSVSRSREAMAALRQILGRERHKMVISYES